MKIFTVHEPPEKWDEAKRGPERFTFVRDGFYVWAFLLGPLWMLWRRLFLVLLGYIVLLVVLDVALIVAGASKGAVFSTHLLLAFLVGLEAASLCRWTLRRRGWREAGVVAADDREAAERRFFDQWDRTGDVPPPAVPPSPSAFSTMTRAAAPSDAIGLFPRTGNAAVSVAIVDYGSGNLHSAAKAVERAAHEVGEGGPVVVTADPERVAGADRIVLPGVGAFADCRAGLDAIPGMVDVLEDAVRRRGRPFLGICVGMQLMAERGLEYEITPGLGWIKGEVDRITPSDPALKIPHMGWNTLDPLKAHPLLDGIACGPQGLHAYFVHSFHLKAADPADLVAQADYGGPVTAIVGRDNLAGTQFHPEKSQRLGVALIGNFLKWKP